MFTCDVIKVYCFHSWWNIDLNKQFFVHFGEVDKRKQTKICVKDIALLFNGDETLRYNSMCQFYFSSVRMRSMDGAG